MVLKVPKRLYELTPYFIFATTILFFAQFKNSNELYILEYAGIKRNQYLRFFVLLISAIFAVDITVINPLVVFCEKQIQYTNKNISFGQTGLWLRGNEDKALVFIHAKSLNATATKFQNIDLIKISRDGDVSSFLHADKGELNPRHWDFYNLTDMQMQKSDSMSLATQLKPKDIISLSQRNEQVNYYSLSKKINLYKQLGLSVHHFIVIWHKMIVKYISYLGFLFLGFILICWIFIDFKIFLTAFAIGISVFFLNEIAYVFVMSNGLCPFPYLWFLPILILVTSLSLLHIKKTC